MDDSPVILAQDILAKFFKYQVLNDIMLSSETYLN